MAPRITRALGLMSGTSADGVDAALVELSGQGLDTRVRVLAHATSPYPADLRQQVLAASEPDSSSVDLICHLNMALGSCFADAALALLQSAGVAPEQVDVVGSHGQTVYHIPGALEASGRQPSTLQLGEPCVIAERTGITTVADFRPRDMAAGGLGAPLSPYGHYLLFADPNRPRAIQNIGGIANVTVLASPDVHDVVAFDTGPGNMLIDEAVRHVTGGRQLYDADGRLAAQGTVQPDLLATLLQHPFLTQPPPKATGRETFGHRLWADLAPRCETLAPADVVRTCTAFTAEAIRLNYERFVFPTWPLREVVVCGGGAANPTLMRLLREALPGCTLTTPEDHGYPNEALEAIVFALLAQATLDGLPASIPRVTGARHPVVLGKVVPGRGWPVTRTP